MSFSHLDRREFLRLSAGLAAGGLLPSSGLADDAGAGSPGPRIRPEMARFPEKTDLILLTDKPPNLETPLKYFQQDLTPNEAFYVRWHLGIVPTRVDLGEFRLTVGGHVEKPLSLSLEELKKSFEEVSVIAVNQCSGNSRSKFEPRMPGSQWGNGAMGNAKWTGVRLKDVLAKAKVKSGAVDVTLNGLDSPIIPPTQESAGTPDYVKSLPFDRANDGEVMIAWAMNGQPLPMLNGFPLRLVVPGWYATYWIKALSEITVLDKKFDGFWNAKAYRVPNNPDCIEAPAELAKETVPIGRMTVRSLVVVPEPEDNVRIGKEMEIQGLAMDSGKGITRVEVSTDGGKSWKEAKLDKELGKYSWRRWRLKWTPGEGRHVIMCKATNAAGETQTKEQWNRSGYARNVIETTVVRGI